MPQFSEERNADFREKVLQALARLETDMAAILENDEDKEKRIRSLEKWKWSHALTGGAIITALLAKFGLPIPGGH